MNSTPEPRDIAGAALQREGVAVSHEWIREYESSPEAEQLERLAGDREMILRVQLEGLGGRTWFNLSRELVAYGTQVIRTWVRWGRIFPLCREKGFMVSDPPPSGIRSADVEGLG